MADNEIKQDTPVVSQYDAVEIIKSDTFKQYRDLLDVELEPDVLYSIDDVNRIINKALKRKVITVINE
nr:MAG TPA: hypothetical protein [Caudoviricetes sp.]